MESDGDKVANNLRRRDVVRESGGKGGREGGEGGREVRRTGMVRLRNLRGGE